MLFGTRGRSSRAVVVTSPSRKKTALRFEELEPRNLLAASWQANPAGQLNPAAAVNGPVGLTPAQVRHAYGFDKLAFANGAVAADGSNQTIAIVDAYNDPNIFGDLHTFDQTFGLPDPPSFLKAMVPGTPVDAGWSGEISLDVEWAHAIAPKANILLVEAPSSGLTDLMSAVDFARNYPGVVAVSMSWGGSEFYGENFYDGYFTTPAGHVGGSGLPGGVSFVASSGDSGAWYGTEWPAVSPNVLSVGGTTLRLDAKGNYQSEAGWSWSGGGFSYLEAEPAFQSHVQTSGVRTVPDVAFDANPSTGFAVFDSVSSGSGPAGWFQVGGTSAGAPQWAAIVALVDQGLALTGRGSLNGVQAAIYSLPAADFHDVTSGSNGYRAGTGYDLVTGRGSPLADRLVSQLVDPSFGANVKSAFVAAVSGTSGTNSPRLGKRDVRNSVSGTGERLPGMVVVGSQASRDAVRFTAPNQEVEKTFPAIPVTVIFPSIVGASARTQTRQAAAKKDFPAPLLSAFASEERISKNGSPAGDQGSRPATLDREESALRMWGHILAAMFAERNWWEKLTSRAKPWMEPQGAAVLATSESLAAAAALGLCLGVGSEQKPARRAALEVFRIGFFGDATS